jgi:hypothetical protein
MSKTMGQHLYKFISELTYNFISLDILDVIQLLFLVLCRLVPLVQKNNSWCNELKT